MKLLIVADDLTGALDTGVQFARHQLSCRVRIVGEDDPFRDIQDIQVLILDAESRHLSVDEARDKVHALFARAAETGLFDHWYKKLDSTLRGNVGAELEGMIRALNLPELMLLNAYPDAGRTTVSGHQYVRGVPLDETEFARDPLNPIHSSSIREILQAQSSYLTEHPEKVHILDAQTREDIDCAVRMNPQAFQYSAGCAGLAESLGQLWAQDRSRDTLPLQGLPLILCGSLNPVTDTQLEHAKAAGLDAAELPDTLLSQDPFALDIWCRALAQALPDKPVLLRSPKPKGPVSEDAAVKAAQVMGCLFRSIMQVQPERIPMIVGGDTLIACIRAAGITDMVPCAEILPGVPVLRVQSGDTSFHLISKAGGFGEENCFTKICQSLLEGCLLH